MCVVSLLSLYSDDDVIDDVCCIGSLGSCNVRINDACLLLYFKSDVNDSGDARRKRKQDVAGGAG